MPPPKTSVIAAPVAERTAKVPQENGGFAGAASPSSIGLRRGSSIVVRRKHVGHRGASSSESNDVLHALQRSDPTATKYEARAEVSLARAVRVSDGLQFETKMASMSFFTFSSV
jgi:hypothetical protein